MVKIRILLVVLSMLCVAFLVTALVLPVVSARAATSATYADCVSLLLGNDVHPVDVPPLYSFLGVSNSSGSAAFSFVPFTVSLVASTVDSIFSYRLRFNYLNGYSLLCPLANATVTVPTVIIVGNAVGSARASFGFDSGVDSSVPAGYPYLVRVDTTEYVSDTMSGAIFNLFFASSVTPFDLSDASSYHQVGFVLGYRRVDSSVAPWCVSTYVASALAASLITSTYYTSYYYSLQNVYRYYTSIGETPSQSYDRGLADGITQANNNVNTDSASYSAGLTAGRDLANSTVNDQSASYTAGVTSGKNIANNTVTTSSASYTAGYNKALGEANNYTFLGLVSSVLDAPVKAFTSLFDFELFGVNLSSFFLALLSISIVLVVLRFALGR